MRIVLVILLLPLLGIGQTMKSILRQLPKDCVPDLTAKQKNILLTKTFFELPDGDSTETIKYELDTPVLKNYISFQFNYTTGQSAFGIFELKRFKTIAGTYIIIFSKYGGARTAYSQDTLKVFTIDNGKLTENKKQDLLPQSVSLDEFLKKGAPDSIKKKVEAYTNNGYYLNTEKDNQVEFNLYTQFMDEELEKWLLGDSFIFTWNGKTFERKLVFKE